MINLSDFNGRDWRDFLITPNKDHLRMIPQELLPDGLEVFREISGYFANAESRKRPYLVFSARLRGELVAIKVENPLANEIAKFQSLAEEADLIASASDKRVPRIVRTDFDSLELFFSEPDDDEPESEGEILCLHEAACFTQELVLGWSLRKIHFISMHANIPIDERELLRICYSLAESIEQLHAKHIIHRDIKPNNIIIDGAQEPHLVDFGLAISTDNLTARTRESLETARGTIGFARYFDWNPLDFGLDVYGLAATAFNIASNGDCPYLWTEEEKEKRREDFGSDLQFPEEFNPDRKDPLAGISWIFEPSDSFLQLLRDALAKDPAQRAISTMSQMRERIGACLSETLD